MRKGFLKKTMERVILETASNNSTVALLSAAKRAGMLSQDYVYIVIETYDDISADTLCSGPLFPYNNLFVGNVLLVSVLCATRAMCSFAYRRHWPVGRLGTKMEKLPQQHLQSDQLRWREHSGKWL
jgi:hypothetical protein